MSQLLPLLLLASACASANGTAPHDMGAGRHEQAAREEDSTAATDAAIAQHLDQCARGSLAPEPAGPCWTGSRDPAAEARRLGELHRTLAEQHRAAAQALREVEARACVGIAPADRDVSPFAHFADIASVEPLTRVVTSSKGSILGLQGATVTLRAVPGLTAEWLQRAIDCHIARNGVLGDDDAGMRACPLGLRSVTATVRSARTGFAVVIRSDDYANAEAIWQRSQALPRREASR